MANSFWDANSESGSGQIWRTENLITPDTPNRNNRIYHRELFENHFQDALDYATANVTGYTTGTSAEVDTPFTAETMRDIAENFDREYNLIHRPEPRPIEMDLPPLEEPTIGQWKTLWEMGLKDPRQIARMGFSEYDAIFDELDRLKDEETNQKVHEIIKGLMKN